MFVWKKSFTGKLKFKTDSELFLALRNMLEITTFSRLAKERQSLLMFLTAFHISNSQFTEELVELPLITESTGLVELLPHDLYNTLLQLLFEGEVLAWR